MEAKHTLGRTDALRLREMALEMATAKATAEVLRVTGHKECQQAESDFQDRIRAFDAALAKATQ